jgi:osmoprotectant transport system substrate-binding protein
VLRSEVKTALAACAAVLLLAAALAACGSSGPTASTGAAALPGAGKPAVTIGDKNDTEQFVLGELYDQALTAKGYSISLNRNIGPTDVTMQAIYAGKLAMYPEYLNVWDAHVAGYRYTFGTLRGAFSGAKRWAERHGIRLLPPTPFSDTVGIGVLRSYATAHALTTLASLRKVASQLTLGAPPQFIQSPHGLPALEQVYGFAPAHVTTIDIGSQYQSLQQGKIQAAYVNTTDPQLTGAAFQLLSDPRQLFGFGNVVPVLSARALAEEGPAFARTIEAVDRLLTTPVMRELNAEVDIDGRTPEAVAQAFLIQHGLVPASTSSSS